MCCSMLLLLLLLLLLMMNCCSDAMCHVNVINYNDNNNNNYYYAQSVEMQIHAHSKGKVALDDKHYVGQELQTAFWNTKPNDHLKMERYLPNKIGIQKRDSETGMRCRRNAHKACISAECVGLYAYGFSVIYSLRVLQLRNVNIYLYCCFWPVQDFTRVLILFHRSVSDGIALLLTSLPIDQQIKGHVSTHIFS